MPASTGTEGGRQPMEHPVHPPHSDPASQPSIASWTQALDEIDRILHQMLLLSELSASDMNTDRVRLQRTLERLQAKIDRIADTLPPELPRPPAPEKP